MRMRLPKFKVQFFGLLFLIAFTTMRSFLVDLGGIYVYCLFIFIAALFAFLHLRKRKFRIRKNSWSIAAWMLIYCAIVTFNFLIKQKSSVYAVYEYVFYAILFFTGAYLVNTFELSIILKIFEVFGIIISTEALWEFSTQTILYRESTETQSLVRAYGLVGSPLTLGMLLCCISLMAVYMAWIKGKVHYVPAILTFAGLLATQSRGPLIALVVGYVIMYYQYQCYLKRERRETIKIILKTICKITLIGIVLVAILVILSNYNSVAANTVERVQTIFLWTEENYSNYQRKHKWLEALDYLKEYPLFGLGVSSTGTHAATGIITESGILKKLVEIGAIGTLAYYGWMLQIVFKGLHNSKAYHAQFYPLAIAIVFSVFVENITLQIIESVTIVFILMIMLPYLVSSGKEIGVE